MSAPETLADATAEHGDRDDYRCPCCGNLSWPRDSDVCLDVHCGATRCTDCGDREVIPEEHVWFADSGVLIAAYCADCREERRAVHQEECHG